MESTDNGACSSRGRKTKLPLRYVDEFYDEKMFDARPKVQDSNERSNVDKEPIACKKLKKNFVRKNIAHEDQSGKLTPKHEKAAASSTNTSLSNFVQTAQLLERRNETLHLKNLRILAENRKLRSDNVDLKNDKSIFLQQNQQLKQQTEVITKEKVDLMEQIKKLQNATLNTSSAEKGSMQTAKDLQHAKSVISVMHKKANELEQKLNLSMKSNSEITNEKNQLVGKVDELRLINASLTNDKSELNEMVKNQEKTITYLKEQIDLLQRTIEMQGKLDIQLMHGGLSSDQMSATTSNVKTEPLYSAPQATEPIAIHDSDDDDEECMVVLTKHSKYICDWAKKHPNFVLAVYERLARMVNSTKVKNKSHQYSFPPADPDQMQLIHEMCGLFGIGSVTAGDEPNQYVHATANSDSSRVPGISFKELAQCRNGHNIE